MLKNVWKWNIYKNTKWLNKLYWLLNIINMGIVFEMWKKTMDLDELKLPRKVAFYT